MKIFVNIGNLSLMISKIAIIISVQLRKTAQIIYVFCAITNYDRQRKQTI